MFRDAFYSRKKNVYIHDYFLNKTLHSITKSIRDLSVIFCAILSFEKYIQTVTKLYV